MATGPCASATISITGNAVGAGAARQTATGKRWSGSTRPSTTATGRTGSRARTWPAPALNNATSGAPFVAEQSQNCLYQVESTTYAGVMPLYRLVMKATDRTTLAAINLGTGSESHSHFNATFVTVDGTSSEVRYLT